MCDLRCDVIEPRWEAKHTYTPEERHTHKIATQQRGFLDHNTVKLSVCTETPLTLCVDYTPKLYIRHKRVKMFM